MIARNKIWIAFIAIALLALSACEDDVTVLPRDPDTPTNPTDPPTQGTGNNYYTQGSSNRTAAEWEPAIGTMVVWPLSIPHTLAVELARDNHLYTLVENDTAKAEAQTWFNTWGIPAANVTFVTAPQGADAWWTRDWGPSAVFTSSNEYFWADGKYPYGTPVSGLSCTGELELERDENGQVKSTTAIDNATVPAANALGYNVMDLAFVNTGGNVATDGLGTALSTCILLKENEHHGVNRTQYMEMNKSQLGFQNYTILSNFEGYGIQHIDCLMKIIDEETLLVAEPPAGHESYSVYNNIVTNELANLRTVYGRPFKIKRIKTAVYDSFGALAAYTNSLILNKVVYVPLFDISQDEQALETWREVMPGYTVKGFKFNLSEVPVNGEPLNDHYGDYGWNGGDALHCRTRAIWDPEMLFITVKKINESVATTDENKVYTTLIDYSGSGLNDENCKAYWRVEGQSSWNEVVLTKENDNHYYAAIPHHESGATVEYYISAKTNSGKIANYPYTAPEGYLKFTIQ